MKNRIKSFIKYTIQQYHSLKPVKSETKAVDDTKLFFLTGYDKSGTTWINFFDGSGNIVASINPNNTDLGDVTIQMDDLAAVGQDNEGEYYLPRFFNFESTNFDGVGSNLP